MRGISAAAVASVLLVAGCTASPGTSGPTASPLPSSTVSTSPAPSPTPSLPASAPAEPSACADSIEAAVRETIDGQFDAFAAEDFAAAHLFASRDFRSRMDVDVFALVIETDFPMILDAVRHDIEDCRQPAPGTVVAVVTLEDGDSRSYEIVYRLLLEGANWRVDGAGNPVERLTA